MEYGGSLIRPEATGYGAVYFAAEMLATRGQEISGKTAAVSGSGNVAQYTIEKLNQMNAKPLPPPIQMARLWMRPASIRRSWISCST
jgi:glutamate dehydrogenase (NADP+)